MYWSTLSTPSMFRLCWSIAKVCLMSIDFLSAHDHLFAIPNGSMPLQFDAIVTTLLSFHRVITISVVKSCRLPYAPHLHFFHRRHRTFYPFGGIAPFQSPEGPFCTFMKRIRSFMKRIHARKEVRMSTRRGRGQAQGDACGWGEWGRVMCVLGSTEILVKLMIYAPITKFRAVVNSAKNTPCC